MIFVAKLKYSQGLFGLPGQKKVPDASVRARFPNLGSRKLWCPIQAQPCGFPGAQVLD